MPNIFGLDVWTTVTPARHLKIKTDPSTGIIQTSSSSKNRKLTWKDHVSADGKDGHSKPRMRKFACFNVLSKKNIAWLKKRRGDVKLTDAAFNESNINVPANIPAGRGNTFTQEELDRRSMMEVFARQFVEITEDIQRGIENMRAAEEEKRLREERIRMWEEAVYEEQYQSVLQSHKRRAALSSVCF